MRVFNRSRLLFSIFSISSSLNFMGISSTAYSSSFFPGSIFSSLFSRETAISSQHMECFREEGFCESDIRDVMKKGYTQEHIKNAITVKKMHDEVELAAYRELVQGIIDFNITTDDISTSQSRKLLLRVKNAAHLVMRDRQSGYMTQRGKYLNKEAQINPLLKRVNWIIHDRDRRLTNASYTSLTQLVYALDSHNSMVNHIIFEAWGYPLVKFRTHLNSIKTQVGFYEDLSEQLKFNLKSNLANVNKRVDLVRSYYTDVEFSDHMIGVVTPGAGLFGIHEKDLDTPLLENLIAIEDGEYLTENDLIREDTTVRQMFNYYFPELILK